MTLNRAGRSPLHYQAFEGPIEDLIQALDAGADPNIADSGGWTPLHFAAQALDPDRVRLLIDHGADVDPQNRAGATPIWVALMGATDDDHGVIGLLLDAGADIDIENVAGISPRGLAESVANRDLEKFLRLDGQPPIATRAAAPVGPSSAVSEPDPPSARPWQEDFGRRWDTLVPPVGQAATVQGEVIRGMGKLTDEVYRNGNHNWGPSHERLLRFVGDTLDDPATFAPEECAAVQRAVATIIRHVRAPDVSGDGSPHYVLSEMAVRWCLAHPDPIPHPNDPDLAI